MIFIMGASQQVLSADVTPNDVSWDDVYDFPGPVYTNTVQITGISTPITLEAQTSAYFSPKLQVGVNTSNSYGGTITDITNGGTFLVNNNEYVTFKLSTTDDPFTVIYFDILNNSDGNALLDSVTMIIDL